MPDDHILLALEFDGKGQGTPLSGEAISEAIKSKKLAWVHLDATQPETRNWLEREVSYLNPYITEALLADETRPRMTQIGDGVLLILRGVNLNKDAAPEDMVSIRLWIDSHRIISVRRRQLKAVWDIEKLLREGHGPKNSGEFLSLLTAQLFARMEPTITGLDDNTDDIEEKLLENPDSSLRERIVQIRKKAIILRRYMSPQRDAVSQLRMADIHWIHEKNKRHLQESVNIVTRYVEDLDLAKERAMVLQDELRNRIAEQQGMRMYVLSLVTAIFLPLSFLTGVFGMNVAGLPGTEEPKAFFYLAMAMVILAIILMVAMLWKKWF